jgi:hypothetical protein
MGVGGGMSFERLTVLVLLRLLRLRWHICSVVV